MISRIARLLEPPLPPFGGVKAFTGKLPIEKIRLFLLVPPRLDTEVFVFPSNPLDFPERGVQIEALEVVERVDLDHEVKLMVLKRKFFGMPFVNPVLNLGLGVLFCISRHIQAGHFQPRNRFHQVVH